ncbi:hypothetical protein [Xylanimonas sp. McL0601]|uniref:hypothetical protein n=1 Tax=Xylanimonas sp. McL0601 TaxID=3414739 RepID=UPI003CF04408
MIWLYARTHHIMQFTIGLLLLGVLQVAAMRSTRSLTSWDGTSSTPLSIAVTAGLGILAASTWHTRGGAHEDTMTTRAPAIVRTLHPPATALTTCLVAAAAAAAVYHSPARVIVTSRSLLFWASLAYLGAVLARPHLAWALPTVYFMALGTIGYTPAGQPAWWNVPMQPPTDTLAWILTVIAVSLGAYSVIGSSARHRRT